MIEKLSFYNTDNTDPYKNLALEEFLTFHTEPSECILFLWQNRRTVVIGKNQNAWKECRVQQLERDGGHLVRRLSGGGAVFHDLGNLNFTFCVREKDYDVAKQTEVILQAVRSLGIDAVKTGRNDLTADGRKFSGHAFYKSRGFCYHHGTLLVDVDQSRMADYLNVSAEKLRSKGGDSVRSRTVNLKELRPDLTIDLLKEKLIEAFTYVYSGYAEEVSDMQLDRNVEEPSEVQLSRRVEELPADRLDWAEIAELEQRFSSWDWKYGRRIPFDHRLEQRFSWGGLEILLHVESGIVQDVEIYSDAMEDGLADALAQLWRGCTYDLPALGRRTDQLKLDSENEEQIRRDVRGMLETYALQE